jgi:photosystem II stability/assembly factor-like uncharacterized protein
MKLTKALLLFIILAPFINLSAQWQQQTSGITTTLNDIVLLDLNTAITVGKNGVILKTTNSGTTWIKKALPVNFNKDLKAVTFFDKSLGIAVGNTCMYITTNIGETWQARTITGNENLNSALFITPTKIYVGDYDGRLYTSYDTGKTWTSEKVSNSPIQSIFAYRGPYVMRLPIFILTQKTFLSSGEFPAGQWNERIIDNFKGQSSGGFCAESCDGGGPTFIVGAYGDKTSTLAILKKNNSDTTWQNVGFSAFGAFYGISTPSSNVIYSCGSAGIIYKSTDGGNNWFKSNSNTSADLYSIKFSNESEGYAVGEAGIILHTINGGLNTITDIMPVLPECYSLEQNYPNPFNPVTTIKYSIPVVLSPQHVTLIVYDVLGKEIITLVNEEKQQGFYEVKFDGTGLSSGVYFYRLKAGNFTQTKKLVLLK